MWVVTWNEIEGFLNSDLDGTFVQGHGVKLTHRAAKGRYTLGSEGQQAKWRRGAGFPKTFYETTDSVGGASYWVNGDDIRLRES
ncbi:hypothetical protein ACIPLC_28940 [Kitasatospora sp. NPDC086801]|uniref:hypothetical protein n=1 Tax=Kitasatospora sp. NPDC086801 TaxID=3364066 RepID=UPI00382D427D